MDHLVSDFAIFPKFCWWYIPDFVPVTVNERDGIQEIFGSVSPCNVSTLLEHATTGQQEEDNNSLC